MLLTINNKRRMAFDMAMKFLFGLLVLLACYSLNFVGVFQYLFSGDGDVIGYMQNTLEIGAFKILLLVAPTISSRMWGIIPKENASKSILLSYFTSGLCAFWGFVIFMLFLRMFVPTLLLNEDRIAYFELGYHYEMYIDGSFAEVVLFHGLLLFASSGFSGVVFTSLKICTSSPYLPFPATVAFVQGISLIGNILKLPRQYRFSNLYAGYFSIFSNAWLDTIWIVVFMLLACLPFAIIAILKGRYSK